MKKYLLRSTPVGWGAILVALSLLLAACGGTASSPTEEAADSAAETEAEAGEAAAEEQIEAAAETGEEEAAPEEAAEEAAPEEAAEEETEASQADENLLDPAASQDVACVPVEIPENNLIAAVSEEDWTKGPADASITVVEYGDFQ